MMTSFYDSSYVYIYTEIDSCHGSKKYFNFQTFSMVNFPCIDFLWQMKFNGRDTQRDVCPRGMNVSRLYSHNW